jgi:asparagine N-glycosylation enzyme membrane subunit Stt3
MILQTIRMILKVFFFVYYGLRYMKEKDKAEKMFCLLWMIMFAVA